MAKELPPDFIEAVKHNQPNPEVTRQLGSKILGNIVGPAAVGKSTVIELACQTDHDFARVVSSTTRPRSRKEPIGTHNFTKHNRTTFDGLRTQMALGNLVQIAIHPTTNYVYSSELAAYPAPYNIVDTLASEVDTMRALPFGYNFTIAVSADPFHWKKWFMERFGVSRQRDDAKKRLHETETNLTWALDDRDAFWLKNIPDAPLNSARNLIAMARGDLTSEADARKYAGKMLAEIPGMLADVRAAA